MTAPDAAEAGGVDDLLQAISDRSDLYTYGPASLPWSYEETQTPFYNDAEGYSCGGNGTGLCEIYRVDDKGDAIWDEDGEPVYIPVFAVENAKMIVERVNGYEALVAERDRLREALQFYANPEIYKPHPDGLAFDRRDLSFHARATLSTPTGTEPAK